ncbi:unnamed protein product [Rotaria sp. Silwood1]|nr:unnamed protein product [Rotaria sp. Silwood1]
MPRSDEAKRQMIQECKKYYWDKPRQLAEVVEFQRVYTREQAIRWYTRPCFIHRLINKALRTEDIVALWNFRYFISDLSTSLAQVRMKIVEPLILYRGTIMTRSEIQLLSTGSLVSANGFFSTSRCRRVAETFIATGQCRNDPHQFVLFEIEIQPNSSDVVFADVAAESHVPDEAEVLFDLGTILEIVHLEQDADTSSAGDQLIHPDPLQGFAKAQTSVTNRSTVDYSSNEISEAVSNRSQVIPDNQSSSEPTNNRE